MSLTADQVNKINKILARPAIQKIRKGTGPKVQAATLQVVRDYVIKNKK